MPGERRIELLGIPLDALTEAECVQHVVDALAAGRGGWVVTPNLDHLRRLVNDAAFRALCADADLAVADGMPLVWASRLQGTPLPERVAGSSLVSTVAAAAARAGRSIYFLGGDEGTADAAADVLRRRCPGLRVAGTHCPSVGFDQDPRQMAEIRARLQASAADIVYVALGSPKQERVIVALRDSLPNAWWLGIGISFSFLAGTVKRAPRWVQRLGLEWAHRLVQEPRRLVRRYLVQGLPFAGRLLLVSFRRRARA